ncbi:492_t:CDS:2 [Gigaspora margarita]|uniref:492_t:CDS:1 n=1 Tax=Gigaspora margarita TaxID=4874 RepID=A0ABN7UNN6_GIGMA|nr:492_t:CDS:2 [Gigaspora margarita]
MVKLPKILKTPDDFNDVVNYIQHRDFAEKYNSPIKKSNFKRQCKNFLYNPQTGHLFFKQPSKGYRWIDVLPQFVIAYNKAPYQAHKKSPYEAFFGFKMHAVYSTPADDIILADGITLADDIIPADDIILADDITPTADIILADTNITPADITLDITSVDMIFAPQNDGDNQASYEFYAMQVKCVHEEVLQNNETYRNKLVIRGSIH